MKSSHAALRVASVLALELELGLRRRFLHWRRTRSRRLGAGDADAVGQLDHRRGAVGVPLDPSISRRSSTSSGSRKRGAREGGLLATDRPSFGLRLRPLYGDPRVRNGYASSGTGGHSRPRSGPWNQRTSRKTMPARARAWTPVPYLSFPRNEGVLGSSPSVGSSKSPLRARSRRRRPPAATEWGNRWGNTESMPPQEESAITSEGQRVLVATSHSCVRGSTPVPQA